MNVYESQPQEHTSKKCANWEEQSNCQKRLPKHKCSFDSLGFAVSDVVGSTNLDYPCSQRSQTNQK
ncbi:unnamed protein product [Dracunculus medinensis]|uniref:Ovule protein n=1 Tax=Dracunculus medinensis TaxID=318479 RepID=A0A0N4UF58_DRAME|nr:unnamed protein product [Dracunculus medinensis]